MPYQNDVFISYRREENAWTPWARDTFKKALGSWLQRELAKPANIFIDEQVPVGADYVEHLATMLAQSKEWATHRSDLAVNAACVPRTTAPKMKNH
jgi:hypothetical protein